MSEPLSNRPPVFVPVLEGAASVRSRGLLVNSAWNYSGAAFTLVATLVTTPLYLRVLGLERFGVLGVLTAVLAPMGVLNAGVTQATVKFVATYTEQRHLAAARESVAASLIVNFGVGLVGALLCLVAAPYFLAVGFKVSPDLVGDAEDSLRLMGCVWFFTQISGCFRGVIEGLRDQRRVVVGDAINTMLMAVFCTLLAVVTGQLRWFVAGQAISALCMVLYWWRQSSRALGGIKLRWDVARRRVGEVYGYSIWQMLNALVAVVANVADRYFIGICMSAVTLGAYNVALRVQTMGRVLFYSMNQVLFPAASAAVSRPGASERMVVTATWHVAFFAGLGLGWMTICGPAFLELWVGQQVAATAGLALRVLVLTLFFEIPSATGSSYLNAHALTRLTAFNNIATTIATLVLLVPLGLYWGVPGVALGALLGLALTRVPFHVWLYRRNFSGYLSRGEYLKAFYGVGISSLLASIAISPLYDSIFGRITGIPGFLVASAAALPLFIGLVLVLVLVVLRDAGRFRELCSVVSTRNIPILSPALARFTTVHDTP